MFHDGRVLEEGKWCENVICQLLAANGIDVKPSTPYEDHRLKVDFWVFHSRSKRWLAIQFTTNRQLVVNGKGADALRRGVIPSWIDSRAIEAAIDSRDGKAVVSQFCRQLDEVLAIPGFIPMQRRLQGAV